MSNVINDLRACFAVEDKNVYMFGHDNDVGFRKDGVYLLVTHRFNKLIGAIMTKYAYDELMNAYIGIIQVHNLAEKAWACGFGYPICFDEDGCPCNEALNVWTAAMNGDIKFPELNQVGDANADVKYVVHLKHYRDGSNEKLYFVDIVSRMTDLDDVNKMIRASENFDEDCDTVVIHPKRLVKIDTLDMIQIN